jgi:hypothetical protein
MVHHKRLEKLTNPDPLLGAMRSCRHAMIEASAAVSPWERSITASLWSSAIDALAALLIRRYDYFWSTDGGAPRAEIARKGGARGREARIAYGAPAWA